MRTLTRILILSLTLLSVSTHANAQRNGEEQAGVEIGFVWLLEQRYSGNLFLRNIDGNFEKVSMSRSSTRYHDIRRTQTLVLYHEVEDPEKQAIVKAPLMEVSLGYRGESSRGLIVFYADQKGTTNFRFLDMNYKQFPANRLKFMNLLSQPIEIKTLGENHVLRQMNQVTLSQSVPLEVLNIDFAYARPSGKPVIMTQRWAVNDARVRLLCFFSGKPVYEANDESGELEVIDYKITSHIVQDTVPVGAGN